VDTRKRILVVDDEQLNLEFFDVMLSKLGFDVHLAKDGQEALEAVRRLHPDLIILDNIMPKLSGWEVTRLIKASPEYAEFADTPIIIFSALDDVKDKVEGLESGADDYITKPFNFAEVLARIRAVLRTHELIGQLENMEKRLQLGDLTLEKLSTALDTTRDALKKVIAAADFETAIRLASKALAGFKDLEATIEALKTQSEGLRNESLDISKARNNLRTHS
jgi:DNA-binding response OmpR family regulator